MLVANVTVIVLLAPGQVVDCEMFLTTKAGACTLRGWASRSSHPSEHLEQGMQWSPSTNLSPHAMHPERPTVVLSFFIICLGIILAQVPGMSWALTKTSGDEWHAAGFLTVKEKVILVASVSLSPLRLTVRDPVAWSHHAVVLVTAPVSRSPSVNHPSVVAVPVMLLMVMTLLFVRGTLASSVTVILLLASGYGLCWEMMAVTNLGGMTLRPAASPAMAPGMFAGMPSSCVTGRGAILKRGVSASALIGWRIWPMLGLMTLNEKTMGWSAGRASQVPLPAMKPRGRDVFLPMRRVNVSVMLL
mmetsp:Transcript_6057/g.14589  ORF Transcript_6057/g.14589 Transcript_6057/m.14589 type:complete len:302 (+) Transcript_6057:11893-12798(+)